MVALKNGHLVIELENGQNGYDVVAEYIRAFWEVGSRPHDDVIVHLATSYDGEDFLERNEIVELDGTGLMFLNDWFEGEKYIIIFGISNVCDLQIPDNFNQLYYQMEDKT